MARKRARMYKVEVAPSKPARAIDMNEINMKKAYYPVTFRTGRHMTEKDRPRRKNWCRVLDN